MKGAIFISILFLLSFLNCYAQRRIPVSTSFVYFDCDKMAYRNHSENMDKGIVFFYAKHTNEWYEYQITASSIEQPNILVGEDVVIVLYYLGRFYYTNTFRMDSLVMNAPFWIFQIEESKYSKKFFGTYYFALSVPPIECGVLQYKNKLLYHVRGKKWFNTIRQIKHIENS